MGCICSKASPVEDSRESPVRRLSASKQYSELKAPRVNSSKREEGDWTKERLDRGDVKVMLIDKKSNGSMRPYDDQNERKKTEMAEATVLNHPCLGKIPKATEGEQIAAGWPGWLSAAAAEAIKGWIPRRADTFEKLNKVCLDLYLVSFPHIVVDLSYYPVTGLRKIDLSNKLLGHSFSGFVL